MQNGLKKRMQSSLKYNNGLSIKEIAEIHDRSTGAIISRLAKRGIVAES